MKIEYIFETVNGKIIALDRLEGDYFVGNKVLINGQTFLVKAKGLEDPNSFIINRSANVEVGQSVAFQLHHQDYHHG